MLVRGRARAMLRVHRPAAQVCSRAGVCARACARMRACVRVCVPARAWAAVSFFCLPHTHAGSHAGAIARHNRTDAVARATVDRTVLFSDGSLEYPVVVPPLRIRSLGLAGGGTMCVFVCLFVIVLTRRLFVCRGLCAVRALFLCTPLAYGIEHGVL